MLKQRLMTAMVGLPLLLLGLVLFPKLYICWFFLLCAAFSVYEMARMLYPALLQKMAPERVGLGQAVLQDAGGEVAQEKNVLTPTLWWPWFCVLAACVMYGVATLLNLSGTERGGIIAVFTFVMLVGTFSARSIELAMARTISALVSLCYGCLPWLSVWDLYGMGSHARYIFLMLAIVMLGDSGAYFAGLHLGRTKLAPRFSPKKTWEGVIGGLCASTLGALLMNALFQFTLGPSWLMMLLALVAGFVGVLGDLVESAFKRFAGVKDSGTIFPGHGGFLDRVDAILFVAPTVWLILYTYTNLAS